MRCFLEQKAISSRPFDEGIDWIPTEWGFDPYFIVTLASSGYPQVAETLWNRFFDATKREGGREQLCIHLALAGESERSWRIAKQHSPNHAYMGWLWKSMAIYDASHGDRKRAEQNADAYFSALRECDSQHIRHRLKELLSFIRSMRVAGNTELARLAVSLYIELADRHAVVDKDGARPDFYGIQGCYLRG